MIEPSFAFLAVLVLLMTGALVLGFPVAFALPGSAILTISLASLAGHLIVGDASAYFALKSDSFLTVLSTGVTNFRAVYWEPGRDTLIAIPLFIFMGILLQRSKVAEDLLVTMAQLFGPIPGGLGISVVLVGGLLAATTGIVGATVITMGLISLPIMMRSKYSTSLAAGTICASGTLGQIIPPSIVLIILADQLASAADVAQSIRQINWASANDSLGFNMPSHLGVKTASAGDIFLGALIPGALILVPLYIVYILSLALLRPGMAPAIKFEGRRKEFYREVFRSLIPPILLIGLVLGSIIAGYATVNQAGAIGASGAILMAGYRLMGANRLQHYAPVTLAITALLSIMILKSSFDLNIRNPNKTTSDVMALIMATGLVLSLLLALGWSLYRIYMKDNILREVLTEAAKTTSMVFIILLGAVMLTVAFRAFGGDALLREALSSMPGGFLAKFLVVMLVMFVLGFFLDFIEISVVVVPITAPILLADPAANISVIWLGVMIAMNIQTSFLTPPFGFALFYLRGVAPVNVGTLEIYRGVAMFIVLQLAALTIVGANERLVNFIPEYVRLIRDTAPPPSQPAVQRCLEPLMFSDALEREDLARTAALTLGQINFADTPPQARNIIMSSIESVSSSYEQIHLIQNATAAANRFESQEWLIDGKEWSYSSLHKHVRKLDGKAQVHGLDPQLANRWENIIFQAQVLRADAERERQEFRASEAAYSDVTELYYDYGRVDALSAVQRNLLDLERLLTSSSSAIIGELSSIEKDLRSIGGVSNVTVLFSRFYDSLDLGIVDHSLVYERYQSIVEALSAEIEWRQLGQIEIVPALKNFLDEVRKGVALRTLDNIPARYRGRLAWCLSSHEDISLRF